MPPQSKRKYTRMTDELSREIRILIEEADDQLMKRAAILEVIGLDKGPLFDNWAKKNLQNLGRRLGYGLIGIDYSALKSPGSQSGSSTRWGADDYMALAKEYVEVELLETSKVTRIDPHTLEIARARTGINKPIPKGLKTAIGPHIPSARSRMVIELMTQQQESVREIEVQAPLHKISDEDLLKEVMRRLPAVIAFYKALPPGFIAPAVAGMPSPPEQKRVRISPYAIVVIGVHPPDRQAFMQRPKIKAQLEHKRMELVFADSGRSFPTGDHTVVIGVPYSGVYKNLRRIRGESHVSYATSVSTAEPMLLEALPPA